MLTRGRFIRRRWYLPLGFVPLVICLFMLTGCGGGDSTKPAGNTEELQKKAQDYNASYREKIIAANKEKVKAKAEAPKKTQ
jgi:hypothetical protein